MGLYRDNGLVLFNYINSQKTEKIRKKIVRVLKVNGFNFAIVTNLVEVDFLDVIFNLGNGSYKSSKKSNNELK